MNTVYVDISTSVFEFQYPSQRQLLRSDSKSVIRSGDLCFAQARARQARCSTTRLRRREALVLGTRESRWVPSRANRGAPGCVVRRIDARDSCGSVAAAWRDRAP